MNAFFSMQEIENWVTLLHASGVMHVAYGPQGVDAIYDEDRSKKARSTLVLLGRRLSTLNLRQRHSFMTALAMRECQQAAELSAYHAQRVAALNPLDDTLPHELGLLAPQVH